MAPELLVMGLGVPLETVPLLFEPEPELEPLPVVVPLLPPTAPAVGEEVIVDMPEETDETDEAEADAVS